MKPCSIHALHGFLGDSQDWDASPLPLKSLSHASIRRKSLSETGQALAESVSHQGKKVLLGYSLGGRIALHSLLECPTTWSAAIMVSTHAGLPTEREQKTRIQSDQHWIQRYQQLEWEAFLGAWNQQPTLQSSKPLSIPQRPEESVIRPLDEWSLGRQEFLLPKLSQLHLPVLWVAGEADTRYVELARSYQSENKDFRLYLCPGAGHRVPWDQPNLFWQNVKEFLNETGMDPA